jgi:ferredoxin
MRVVVDLDLCQGHGVCESEAPEVFEVPKHDKVRVLQPEPPEAARDAVFAAIRYCPTRAISIEED